MYKRREDDFDNFVKRKDQRQKNYYVLGPFKLGKTKKLKNKIPSKSKCSFNVLLWFSRVY